MVHIPARTERFYAAERFISSPWTSDHLPTFEEIVAEVTAGPWWRANAPGSVQEVAVRKGRSKTFSAIAYPPRGDQPARITVSEIFPRFEPRLIAHELAHHAAGKGGHHLEWAASYYQLLGLTLSVRSESQAECYRIRNQFEFAAGLAAEGFGIEPFAGITPISELIGRQAAGDLAYLSDAEIVGLLEGAFTDQGLVRVGD